MFNIKYIHTTLNITIEIMQPKLENVLYNDVVIRCKHFHLSCITHVHAVLSKYILIKQFRFSYRMSHKRVRPVKYNYRLVSQIPDATIELGCVFGDYGEIWWNWFIELWWYCWSNDVHIGSDIWNIYKSPFKHYISASDCYMVLATSKFDKIY